MECPLTKKLMKDPVKAEDSDIVFEREAIENFQVLALSKPFASSDSVTTGTILTQATKNAGDVFSGFDTTYKAIVISYSPGDTKVKVSMPSTGSLGVGPLIIESPYRRAEQDASHAILTTAESFATTLVPQTTLRLEIEQFSVENVSALHMACGLGDVEAVKQMVHKTMSSESLNRMDLDRKTPLEYALSIKHEEIIAILRDCDNIVEDFGEDSIFENASKLLQHQLRMRIETDTDYGSPGRGDQNDREGDDSDDLNFREYHHTCGSGFLKPWANPDFKRGTTSFNLQCPLSCSLFVDPVIADDGISYSRLAIQHWFDSGMTLSPLTNERMSTNLTPNVALRSQTEQWINENKSPIHMACIYGDLKMIQQLVDKDSSSDLINLQDVLGDTPLELAARYGSTEIVRLLLACEHVTVSYPVPTVPAGQQWTDMPTAPYNALYWAAKQGHVNIVSLLLNDHRSNANLIFKRWGRHFTAFAVAVFEGHEDVTQLMLSHDLVDVNLPLSNSNGYWGKNFTALHLAAIQGHATIIEMFLQEKLKNTDRVDLNPVDDDGWTPFHRAVERGHVNAVRVFLSFPALVDINRIADTNHPGYQDSPLHTACHGDWYKNGYEAYSSELTSLKHRTEMVRVLLGNENIITTEINDEGNTPLVCCVVGHSRWGDDSIYKPKIAASMGVEFLKRGVGAKVSTWYDRVQGNVQKYLSIESLRVQRKWQKPMVIFNLSRLSAANDMSQDSSLNAFSKRWPLLVGNIIEEFLFPQQKIRTEFEELIIRYKAKSNAASLITIRVKDQGGDYTFFRMKMTTTMSKVFGAYAERKGVSITSFRFYSNGEIIDADETPKSLELENQDQRKSR